MISIVAEPNLAPAVPEQTARRRKVVKQWEKFHGLTAAQIAAAQKVVDELQGNPAMRQIGWDEVLGSNEWKMQRWTSLTTGRVCHIEIVIGEAL